MNMPKNLANFSFFIVIATLACVQICHAQNSQQDFIDGQNAARAAVGVPNLQWDDRLQSYAQQYANQRIGDCALKHSGGPYGENIFAGGDANSLTAKSAVQGWVDEKANYDYNTNTCAPNKMCGHYTQIVWRDTTRLGCARVQCNSGGMFVICSYDPRGNFAGQKPY